MITALPAISEGTVGSQYFAWGSLPLGKIHFEDGHVERFNAFKYYSFCVALRPLSGAQTGLRYSKEYERSLLVARVAARDFVEQEDPKLFRSSRERAEALEKIIQGILNDFSGAVNATFTEEQIRNLHYALGEFEIVLNKELSDTPAFIVEEKGNFSVSKLTQGASIGYSTLAISRLTSECKTEVDEAGRCLAFSRPTASGFHILRAVELVVKQLIVSLGLTVPPVQRCNWGEYISILRDGNAPKEITDLLQVLKDNYRNPIMHPEQTLDIDESVGLFSMCQSVIEVLCKKMP